jgi:hypothetical protein
MIIWDGLGFLVVVFVFGAALLCNWAFDAAYGAGYYSSHMWTIGVAMFISGGLSWIIGDRLRKRSAQVVIDKATGTEFLLDRATHRLFFVPMYYWGAILGVIGTVLCGIDLFG